MTEFNGYIWNAYLPQQYLWDGTCGYHAIKNTINLTYVLNKYHIDYPNNNYQFNDLLLYNNTNHLTNININELSRNYYIYLNNGIKYASEDDLINIKNKINKNNKIYFWNKYEDKMKIKSLIENNIDGIFGIIIHHNDILFKHWYGIVIDINNNNKKLHLLDSYGVIHQTKKQFIDVLTDLNITIQWKNYYNQNISYIYKIYQSLLFIIVYFIIIYGIIYYFDKCKKHIFN